ncbi:unnamed protein product [Arabidopsis thaliana]|uniref:(thale cress) hypothetical protein n=1 Tax=Arabidopsis thaliana TaxID=3702 RepID=A0A7G2FIE9_ARATH|nr:unnamed protein product [Arabidopsis thaliana]
MMTTRIASSSSKLLYGGGMATILDHHLRSARVVQAHRRFSVPARFCNSWMAAQIVFYDLRLGFQDSRVDWFGKT